VIEVIENQEELENNMHVKFTVNFDENQADLDVEKIYNNEQITTKN